MADSTLSLPLFPATARINAEDHLEIGGCDVVALASEFGTPLYVFDEAHLCERARTVREAFQARYSNTLPLYATKAYFSPYLARLYKDAGLGLDVTSEGELEIARRVDFPRDHIYLHGNNKTAAEIHTALTLGVEHIILDNLDEIPLVERIAKELNVRPRVLLRLAPAIDPHTHRYLATGVAESKFGLPLATGDAVEAARRIADRAPHLRLVGLHAHIGSQIFDLAPFRTAVETVLDFARELQDAVGFRLEELDLGGGWGVAYTEDQKTLPDDEVAEAIVAAVRSKFFLRPRPAESRRIQREGTEGQVPRSKLGIGEVNLKPETWDLKLLLEPGRALIAASAVALYTVGSVKEITGVRSYVSVDGGMGDNIRPALYGARYTARAANKMNQPATTRVAIAGRYCEQGDILIEEVNLPPVIPGDLIAVPLAGAYQIPMASNYNLIPRPAVLAVREGKAHVIRRRETIDDMLRCESPARSPRKDEGGRMKDE